MNPNFTCIYLFGNFFIVIYCGQCVHVAFYLDFKNTITNDCNKKWLLYILVIHILTRNFVIFNYIYIRDKRKHLTTTNTDGINKQTNITSS